MLSIVILTKNEEDRIIACLESVKWADEIVIVDNDSKDKTLELAREYTDKIFKFKNQDYAAFRNWAFGKTLGDWVLYIDPDERVLSDLKIEIEGLTANNKCSAYAISRKNIVLGQKVSYGPYRSDWVIRLLKRSSFEMWVGKIHEYPKFRGELGYAKSKLLHLTHRDLDQIILKSLEWSKIDAKLRLDVKHPKMNGWRFLRIFFSELFNQGIKREGFFGGTVGIIDSILQTFSMFISYVRLWQMQQEKPLNELYNDIDKKLIKDKFKYQ